MGQGETCRDLIEDKKWLKTLAFPAPGDAAAASAAEDGDALQTLEQTYTVEVSGQALRRARARPPVCRRGHQQRRLRGKRGPSLERQGAGARRSRLGGQVHERRRPGHAASPLQGNMWKVLVKQGDTVEEGQLLCIIEAMKMENEITAHKAGTIAELPIVEGEAIQAGAPIATIVSAETG